MITLSSKEDIEHLKVKVGNPFTLSKDKNSATFIIVDSSIYTDEYDLMIISKSNPYSINVCYNNSCEYICTCKTINECLERCCLILKIE